MKRYDASAFVDWQSQLINSGSVGLPIRRRAAEDALRFVSEEISDFLEGIDSRAYFFVEMKIYHGWHRGLTPTDNFVALRDINRDNSLPKRVGRVTFGWKRPFGNILEDCYDHRLHDSAKVHLPNTLRADIDDPSRLREKMTDTALCCDVLCSARSSPSDIRLILAEDDDLVPAAFVAERWAKEHGGRTYILRTREQSQFINLSGIYKQMRIKDAD